MAPPPIGICDSGSGGLTVLNACAAHMPGQSFIYLGDHGRAPYGHRTEKEVFRFTVDMIETLFKKGVKLVIVACNTASALALRKIQEEWLPQRYPERRVLGVLVPMVEALTGIPWDRENPGQSPLSGHTVGIFATERTVESGAYPHQVHLRAPDFLVYQQPCPGLVAAIESDHGDIVLEDMVKGFCKNLLPQVKEEKLDAVILGCTHYPLVEHLFRKFLPDDVKVLSQPEIVARSLKGYLARHPEFASANGAGIEFYTTGDPETFRHIGKFMPGVEPDFKGLSV